MPKSGTSGSVRGAVSNDRPYRDTLGVLSAVAFKRRMFMDPVSATLLSAFVG